MPLRKDRRSPPSCTTWNSQTRHLTPEGCRTGGELMPVPGACEMPLSSAASLFKEICWDERKLKNWRFYLSVLMSVHLSLCLSVGLSTLLSYLLSTIIFLLYLLISFPLYFRLYFRIYFPLYISTLLSYLLFALLSTLAFSLLSIPFYTLFLLSNSPF